MFCLKNQRLACQEAPRRYVGWSRSRHLSGPRRQLFLIWLWLEKTKIWERWIINVIPRNLVDPSWCPPPPRRLNDDVCLKRPHHTTCTLRCAFCSSQRNWDTGWAGHRRRDVDICPSGCDFLVFPRYETNSRSLLARRHFLQMNI